MSDTENTDTAEKTPPILKHGDTLISGYQVLNHMQRGKDYDVYNVWSSERHCRCIAKTLRPDRIHKTSSKKHLLREGQYLQTLTHPNLVRAYEVYSEPCPTMIQETLTGETLSHLIQTHKQRRLPLKQLAHLGIQLCSVIHYLHQHGILHLDLKSSNIISQPPLAKVIDLSIAAKPGQKKQGAGTRKFMAPEQARGDELNEAADIWGIGAVLFHAATGKRPFLAYESERYDQLERRADHVHTHRRVPALFADTIDQCLEPEPAERPDIEQIEENLQMLVK